MSRTMTALLTMAVVSTLVKAGDDATFVWDAHKSKVAHVEVVGTLHNGTSELVQAGSGLRVGQPFVLTSAHLFARASNYKSIRINVRFGSRSAAPHSAQVEINDQAIDLALLRVPGLPVEQGCPYFLITDMRALRPGADLFFLGYPIDRPLRLSLGVLSVEPDEKLPTWDTSALLNPGNSGGPGFSRGGYLAGIAKGALTDWRQGTEVVPLAGISTFVPSVKIRSSAIGDFIFRKQQDEGCLRAVAMNSDGSFGLGGGPLAPIDPPSRLTVAQAIFVSWQRDEGLAPKSRTVEARTGYVIDKCTFEPIRRLANVQASCTVENAGRRARADFVAIGDPKDQVVRSAAGHLVLEQRPGT